MNEPIATSQEDSIRIDTRLFHGHPDYLDMTIDELRLHSAKNRDYARGGDPLGNFRRVASILSNYPGLDLSDPTVVAIVFSMKQMDAALWQLSQHFEGDLEGFDERARDVHVYWKIARILHKEEMAARFQYNIPKDESTVARWLVELDSDGSESDKEKETTACTTPYPERAHDLVEMFRRFK